MHGFSHVLTYGRLDLHELVHRFRVLPIRFCEVAVNFDALVCAICFNLVVMRLGVRVGDGSMQQRDNKERNRDLLKFG